MLTWKTVVEKNHGSPETPIMTIRERCTIGDLEAMTSSSMSSRTSGYNREYFLFFSHTLYHSYALCTTMATTKTTLSIYQVIALSHIYTNTTLGLFTNIAIIGALEIYLQTCPWMWFTPNPFSPVSSFGSSDPTSPILIWIPSGRTKFSANSPFTWHGMSCQSDPSPTHVQLVG